MTTLKRLLPAHDIDALLGDIAEERPRRSRFWYWSQLLALVVVASWRATSAIIRCSRCPLDRSVALRPARRHHDERARVLSHGWAIVRLYRAHGIAMAISFLIMAALLALVPLLGGALGLHSRRSPWP